MNHLQVYQLETHVSPSEQAWYNWVNQVEAIIGHSLDGNQSTDGYSLDISYDWFKLGISPDEMASKIKSYVIRFGGLVESFYIDDTLYTCHKSEATRFTRQVAEFKANKLQTDYSKGVRAVKA